MTSDPCRMVLVRHGEMAACDVVPGHRGCPGLSPLGRRQAQALASRLRQDTSLRNVAAVYSSRMLRARETAEVAAAAVDVGDVIEDCELCELHDGDADGVSIEAAVERWWRPALSTSRRLPWNSQAPGAESAVQMTARASGALHRLAMDHLGETILLVTHGGVIRASFFCFADMSFRSTWTLEPANASITEWLIPGPTGSSERWPPLATLAGFNDTSHLRSLT